MSPFQELKVAAAALFDRSPIERHPLLARLAAGALSPAQVRAVALQIHHVVDRFPRFLAALIANIADWRERMRLVDNLYEEHGRMAPAAVHVETYRAFLCSIGCTGADVESTQPALAVVVYNRAVGDLCTHHHVSEALGAMGVIEEIVARASVVVGRACAAGARQPVAHFGEHEILDVAHADEIYELAGRFYCGDTRAHVDRGMALGMYYHRRLYSDLLEWVASEC